MNKKNYTFWYYFIGIFLIYAPYKATAQSDFIGLNTNPQSGINGIDINPVNIVGTIYKVDVNLAGGSFFSYNNYLGFNPALPFVLNRKRFEPIAFSEKMPKSNIYENARYSLPSFMVDIDLESAMAVTLQARTFTQITNIDEKLGKSYANKFKNSDITTPTAYSADGLDMLNVSWGEIGLAYGRVHYNDEKRFKWGVRAKYIAALAGTHANFSELDYTLTPSDSAVNVTNAKATYMHTTETNAQKFKMQGSSFGFDIGIKYSYLNKYIVGLSVLDIGKIKFNADPTATNFKTTNTNWELYPFGLNNIKEFDKALKNNSTATNTAPSTFDVILPTAISLQATAYLWEGGLFEGAGYHNFYVSLATYTPIPLLGSAKSLKIKQLGTYTATVGYNSDFASYGLPITINELGKVDVGGFLRSNLLFVGTKNLLTSVFNKKISETDFYAGIKFSISKPEYDITASCAKHF